MDIQFNIKENRSKGGKAPRKPYRYSLSDIAEASGKSIYTVRRDKRIKKLDPNNFKQVVDYIRVTKVVHAG